jgi:hypothetical protein
MFNGVNTSDVKLWVLTVINVEKEFSRFNEIESLAVFTKTAFLESETHFST